MDVSVRIYNSESGIYRKHERVNLYNEPELIKILKHWNPAKNTTKSEDLFLFSINAIESVTPLLFFPPHIFLRDIKTYLQLVKTRKINSLKF